MSLLSPTLLSPTHARQFRLRQDFCRDYTGVNVVSGFWNTKYTQAYDFEYMSCRDERNTIENNIVLHSVLFGAIYHDNNRRSTIKHNIHNFYCRPTLSPVQTVIAYIGLTKRYS